MISIIIYQHWTLDSRIGSESSDSNNAFSDVLAWFFAIYFLFAPFVGSVLAIASLFRGKAHIGTALSGLILNSLCALVFLSFAFLLFYSGV